MYNSEKYPEFHEIYQEKLNRPPWDHEWNKKGFPPEILNLSSDISAHLSIISYFASQCDVICELGTRTAFSTCALLSNCRDLVISYDLHTNSTIQKLQRLSDENKTPCRWEFIKANTVEMSPIDYCDMLFVDSLHEYKHVKKELKLHGDMPHRYIIFHDTFSQWENSIDRRGEKGIGPAIEEFIKVNPWWKKIYQVDFNHGLLVLERGT